MSHWQNKKEHVKRQFEMVLQLHAMFGGQNQYIYPQQAQQMNNDFL